MNNVPVALQDLKGLKLDQMREVKVRPGFKYVGTHMIFDIKTNGKFTRKSRIVAGGNKTAHPLSITYSSVVTRESVTMAFLISGMRNMDIFACGNGNAYLDAPCLGEMWT